MAAHSNGVSRKRPLNDTFAALPTTVFTVMTNLANEHGSINLGQGFPDEEGPASMKARSSIRPPRPTAASNSNSVGCNLRLILPQDLVGKAVQCGPNQYTNLQGIPEARQVKI